MGKPGEGCKNARGLNQPNVRAEPIIQGIITSGSTRSGCSDPIFASPFAPEALVALEGQQVSEHF